MSSDSTNNNKKLDAGRTGSNGRSWSQRCDLMWRDDPVESFSDWKIVVHFTGTTDAEADDDDDDDGGDLEQQQQQTYHVHQNILARGPRKSEYFVTLFRNANDGRFQESQCTTSIITLDNKLTVKAFPIFLDYIYGGTLEITSTTATALHHLGNYFGVNSLVSEVEDFCRKDMSEKNKSIYSDHTAKLHNETISALLAKVLEDRERRRQKERFLMFTRVLLKYLETKDQTLHQRVKAIIKDCETRNKKQEPGYESVTCAMKNRLKPIVPSTYWTRAESYLAHFLAQKQRQAAQQQQQQQQQQQGQGGV